MNGKHGAYGNKGKEKDEESQKSLWVKLIKKVCDEDMIAKAMKWRAIILANK